MSKYGGVALFFMYRSFGGGTTSYTVHLFEGMRLAGLSPKIYRVKERGEPRERPFAKYDGVTYRNVDSEEAIKIAKSTPSLMTAPCNSKFLPFDPTIIAKLMKVGMRVTVHDPNEFEIYDHLEKDRKSFVPFCIRPSMKQFFPKAIFVPHPYVREYDATEYEHREREHLAVSVARVTFVKRTHLILEANAKLPREKQVVLRGAENRLYTRFKVQPMFPKFKQGRSGFPMVWGASARECARGHYAVDFTWFPDDGGGSQYSSLEAWDAGAVNVIHQDWLRYKGEMVDGENCIAVDGPDGLARLLSEPHGDSSTGQLVDAGYAALKAHDPVRVARQYHRELTK
jgi:hypothetical protein